MSFHKLDFTPNRSSPYFDLKPLPPTLEVMYEAQSVALAVYHKGSYSFNLPDEIGAKIDFSDLRPFFIYGKTGKGWSKVLEDDDDILYIVLEPVGESAEIART